MITIRPELLGLNLSQVRALMPESFCLQEFAWRLFLPWASG